MPCPLHRSCSLPDGPVTIGSDEVGWGALAGPLYVVGVALPKGWHFRGLRDSKKYTIGGRRAVFERLVEEIRDHWTLSITPPEMIDALGAQRCLVEAHTTVLQQLIARTPRERLERVIVDGALRLPRIREAVAIPKADATFPAVSAASVLAKVLRDDVMLAMAATYPQYGFDQNMGYGTEAHLKAIKRYGLCPAHRRSYLRRYIKV